MRRTIAVTVVVGLLMMGLTAAIASADKGGVPHEGSNGKGRTAQGAPPAASEQQDAPAPARRTPPPRKKERANRHTQQKAEHHRRQPPAVAPAPAPATAPSQRHGQPKLTICHHTGSQSNPWVQITVAEPALKAHRKHGDVIPAPAAGCGNAEEQPQPDEPVGSPGGDAQTPTPSSGPTFAAGSAAQPMPDGGLGPVWIVHRSVPRGAVLAETASSSPGKARGRVLAARAS